MCPTLRNGHEYDSATGACYIAGEGEREDSEPTFLFTPRHCPCLALCKLNSYFFFFFFLFNSRIAPCGKYFSLRSSSVTFIFLHSLNDNTALSLKEEENEKKKELRYTIAASCDDTRTKTEIKRERVGVGRGTR